LNAVKDAARHVDLSFGQALRRGAQMWLAKHETLPDPDPTPKNNDWIHRRRSGKRGAR
jgi:hypothetical protein